MSRVSDLVKDSKLEALFHPEYTVHIYIESGHTALERTTRREEYWKRGKHIKGGSYGSVWLEQCVEGKREIGVRAVKQIIKPPQLSKPVNYNRELEAISKFSHRKYERCFVKSFGWYESPQAVCIAMEYCEQGDLQNYLAFAPPLPEQQSQEVAFQILEGLNFMHENGFSHRDLKPGNILIISKPPESWWVKLSDFGISKRTEDGVALLSTVKGTLAYMAPELLGFGQMGIEITPRIEHAADMWAMGEITFQMLTKEPTFKNPGALLAYVQNSSNFPSNLLRTRGISDKALEFIQELMLPSPDRRLPAEKALLHPWLEAHKAHALELSRGEVTGLPRPNEVTTDIAVQSEPSGRWSTVSRPNIDPEFLPTITSSTVTSIQNARSLIREPDSFSESSTVRLSDRPTQDLQTVDDSRYNTINSKARYFILKSSNTLDIETSIALGIWSCGDSRNTQLSKAYKASTGPIFLFFSVNASRKFCGAAEMKSAHDPSMTSEHWVEEGWNGGFLVNWLSWINIGFDDVRHLRHKEVDGVPITTGRVVFEICASSGAEMMRRFGLSPVGVGNNAGLLNGSTVGNLDMGGLLLSTSVGATAGASSPLVESVTDQGPQIQRSNKRSNDSFEEVTDSPNKKLTMSNDVSMGGVNIDSDVEEESLFV